MSTSTTTTRPPVIAIMGHVDHGKSSLLDYIRESNVVAGEAGGITQHVSAYEVEHADAEGATKRITFIDTPGHAAFSGMRQRGAAIADIAILIISAEDSIKTQTIEAIEIIKEREVPFLVAINKVDKPDANPDKVKTDLMEHEIFLEGYGGDTPYAEISAKTGQGIDELLETILILAELQEFTGIPEAPASGFVVESHQDAKRGTTATLIIKDGTLRKGQFVVSGCGMASTRMLEDFGGTPIDEASFSSPVQVIGFSEVCIAGAPFVAYETKKEAEAALSSALQSYTTLVPASVKPHETNIVPVILKADVEGMIEAVVGEIEAQSGDGIFFKIIKTGIGSINESDAQLALADEGTIILGFNVSEDKSLANINGIDALSRETFSIIYKMTEWLQEYKDKYRHRKKVEEIVGELKVLKVFSNTKTDWVVGGRVTSGTAKKMHAHIVRNGEHVADGIIKELQQAKSSVAEVPVDSECGLMIDTTLNVVEGDVIQVYTMVTV